MRTYTDYKERLKVGGFSDLVRNDRRDNAIREVLENPEFEDAPILDKLKQLETKEKTDTSEYQDAELNILLD